MSWIYYLLEANLYLLAFFAFYLLFLRSETFYNSNRFYLIGTSLIAFILPLVQLGIFKPNLQAAAALDSTMGYALDYNLVAQPQPVENLLTFNNFILGIYIVIALFFVGKMVFGILRILHIYRNANTYKHEGSHVVELSSEQTAFSFMNLLFINPSLSEKDVIFRHELIHIKQKHTWDVLLFEVIQAINWFNPLIHFLKKEVKVLHEYIADELATDSLQTKHEYAMVLIENSLQYKSYPLANQFFNQSILKRRIIMLNKEKTQGWARLKIALVLPLAGGMLAVSTMAFTDKTYDLWDLAPKTTVLQDSVLEISDEVSLAKKGFYSPNYTYDKNDQYKSLEKRLIVINGIAVKDNNQFYGGTKADKIVFLKPEEGVLKYGERAKYGAVEISGKKIEFRSRYLITDTLKFPEPKIQNQKKSAPSIPPVKVGAPVLKPDKKSSLKPSNEIFYASSDTDTQNKMKEITIVAKPSNKVQGIQITPNQKPVNEISIEGRPLQKVQGVPLNGTGVIREKLEIVNSPNKKVQGLQLAPATNGKLKELTIKAVPSNKVQGKPLNGTGKVQQLEIITKPNQQEPIYGDPTPDENQDQAKLDQAVKKAIIKEIQLVQAKAKDSSKN